MRLVFKLLRDEQLSFSNTLFKMSNDDFLELIQTIDAGN